MPPGRLLRIQVTGRARAGKTTVRNALALQSAEETAPIDEPGQPDPVLDADLVLYILAGTVRPADRRALATVPSDRALVLLNKADTIGTRWSDAATAAESHSAALGLPVFPVVASLAAHTRAGTLTDADLRTLRLHRHRTDPAFTLTPDLFTTPDAGADVANRQLLLARWALHGVACALAALHHDPSLSPCSLLQILHSASGIDPVHHELHRRYELTSTPCRS
ncbi:GTPase domain-containing protein [Nocardia sp. IFM 10818]